MKLESFSSLWWPLRVWPGVYWYIFLSVPGLILALSYPHNFKRCMKLESFSSLWWPLRVWPGVYRYIFLSVPGLILALSYPHNFKRCMKLESFSSLWWPLRVWPGQAWILTLNNIFRNQSTIRFYIILLFWETFNTILHCRCTEITLRTESLCHLLASWHTNTPTASFLLE